MSEIKLLPCPFCGKDAQIAPDEIGSGGQHVPPYHAGCLRGAGCGIAFTADESDEAIAEWNRRAALSSTAVAEREPVYDEAVIDQLRIKAFKSNAPADREAYFNACSKWFQDRHYRRISAPPTSELEAEIARLEARLAEAMKALEMFPELFLSFVGPANDEWFNRFADAVKNARRVREGGKVE